MIRPAISRHRRPSALLATAISVAVVASSCGSDSAGDLVATTSTAAVVDTTTTIDTTTTDTTTTIAPAADPIVAATLSAYSNWSTPTRASVDERGLTTDEWVDVADDSTKTSVACAPAALPQLSRSFDQFPAFGFSGTLAPGLVVEGAGVEPGDLRVVPLGRAPLTLVSSLASENPTVVVDDPDSTSLAEAVARLKRDADARLTGIDVVPSDITYTRTETHSFEQSSLEIGVSLRYDGPLRQAGLDSSFNQESQTEKHSIAVQLIQPMYTIRMADDAVRTAGDFFSADVTPLDVEALVDSGEVGPDNPPLVIDEVTYGRVMYFTMTSTSATSAQDLMIAVDAAQAKFSGSAELTEEQRQTLSTSDIAMLSYGGDQSLALGAIKSGDLGQFFGPANTTTAAPLSFSLRTLGGQLVEVADTADLQQLLCSRTEIPYSFNVSVSNITGRVRVLVNGAEVLDAANTPDNLLTLFTNEFRPGSGSANIDSKLQPGIDNVVEVKFDRLTCVDAQFSLRIDRDGTNVINKSLSPRCAFFFTWEYGIDTTTGRITDNNDY
ncbi:MAG: thiol-activated cytolysin family protein [Acidimicrobiales bacterium]